MAMQTIIRLLRCDLGPGLAQGLLLDPLHVPACMSLLALCSAAGLPALAANVAAAKVAFAGQTRGLQFSALMLENAAVVVPSMGESITEGTIATVLKKPGEHIRDFLESSVII